MLCVIIAVDYTCNHPQESIASVIGPFATRDLAEEWETMNFDWEGNVTFEIHDLLSPSEETIDG